MADLKAAVANARDGLDDARARISSEIAVVRAAAPRLTTGLLVASLFVGAGLGAFADHYFTRWAVNREWRERIAAAKAPTQEIITKGNADAADVDAAAIETVKGAFDNAAKAEKDLQDLQRKFSSATGELDLLKTKQQRDAETARRNRCSVPADCLRQQ